MTAPLLQAFARRWRPTLPSQLAAELDSFVDRNRAALDAALAAMLRRAPSMPKVLSYGGGADSFAMLLDAIERGEPPDQVVFCDVADSTPTRTNVDVGEWPGTYKHIREVVMPLCACQGIEFIWLDTQRYPVRDARSLFRWLWDRRQIPVAGPNRICTIIAKTERFERWMNDRYPGQDVEVWIGFEAGEDKRAEKDPNAGTKRKLKPGDARRHNRFPLMERNMCRCRAVELINRLGYPVPRKSACQLCPYGSLSDWQAFAREDPRGFGKTVELEARKPPTKAGKKLSIMSYRTLKDADGKEIGYKSKPLPLYILGKPRGRLNPCTICGAARKATKAAGCGYRSPRSTMKTADVIRSLERRLADRLPANVTREDLGRFSERFRRACSEWDPLLTPLCKDLERLVWARVELLEKAAEAARMDLPQLAARFVARLVEDVGGSRRHSSGRGDEANPRGSTPAKARSAGMMSWDALEAERRRLGAVAVVQAEDLRRGDLVLVEGQRATVEDIQGYPAFIIQDGEEVLNPEAQFLVLHLRRGGTKLEHRVLLSAPHFLVAPEKYDRGHEPFLRDLHRAALWRGLALVFTPKPRTFADERIPSKLEPRAWARSIPTSPVSADDADWSRSALAPVKYWTDREWLPFARALAARKPDYRPVILAVVPSEPPPPGVPAFKLAERHRVSFHVGEFVPEVVAAPAAAPSRGDAPAGEQLDNGAPGQGHAAVVLGRVLSRLRGSSPAAAEVFDSWAQRHHAKLLREVEHLVQRLGGSCAVGVEFAATACDSRPRTRSELRSALSEVTAYLHRHGFLEFQRSRIAGRSRPGYHATVPTGPAGRGCVPAVYLFGDHCKPGEFARVCDALVEGGWQVEDAQGGKNHVAYGCARVRKPETASS